MNDIGNEIGRQLSRPFFMIDLVSKVADISGTGPSPSLGCSRTLPDSNEDLPVKTHSTHGMGIGRNSPLDLD